MKCTKAPSGWECHREKDHDGPCAAVKTGGCSHTSDPHCIECLDEEIARLREALAFQNKVFELALKKVKEINTLFQSLMQNLKEMKDG